MNPNLWAALVVFLGLCLLAVLFLWVRLQGKLALVLAEKEQSLKDNIALRALSEQQEAQLEQQWGEQVSLKEEKASLHAQVVEVRAHLEQLCSEHEVLKQSFQETQAQAHQLDNQLIQVQTRRDQEERSFQEKLVEFKDVKAKLSQEFENLANRIFDEKGKKLSEQHQTELKGLFTPLKQQIGEFKEKVEKTYDLETRDRVALKWEIGQLKELNHRLADEALNLTQALKGQAKTQGDWGEMILERVLEYSGLTEGRDYELQTSFTNATGGQSRPDVILHLPQKRDLVLDAKVSLIAYERYCSAKEEPERQGAIKDHLTSIKNHIRGLSDKDYQDLPQLKTLDFVLLFIPLEAAFLLAHDQDPGLFQLAYDKNILLTSPSTLMITLRMIKNLWRTEAQSQNAQEIALQAGKMLDKFTLLIEAVDELGRNLDRAQESQKKLVSRLNQGKGNLVGQAKQLVSLGAVGKKALPVSTEEAL